MMNKLEEKITEDEVYVSFEHNNLTYDCYWKLPHEFLHIDIYMPNPHIPSIAKCCNRLLSRNVKTKEKAIELVNNFCEKEKLPYKVEITNE